MINHKKHLDLDKVSVPFSPYRSLPIDRLSPSPSLVRRSWLHLGRHLTHRAANDYSNSLCRVYEDFVHHFDTAIPYIIIGRQEE